MEPLTGSPASPQPSAPDARPPHDREKLIGFLEPDQLARDRSVAVPAAHLSGRTRAALWMLRIFALVLSFMVMYTFVSQLH
jgi:hypothetical protein